MDVWLGWQAAALNLNDSAVSSCSLSRTGGRLLLKRRGKEAQTEHKDLVLREEKSVGNFFVVNGLVSAHLNVTLDSHLYVRHSGTRKKLLRKTRVVEEMEVRQLSVLAGHG